MTGHRLGVSLRPLAVTDLETIWRYTAQAWNVEQADQYLDQLNERLELLAENPSLGLDYSHVEAGVQRYQVGRHGVFYRIDNHLLVVIRVLHDRMDAPRRLSDSDQGTAILAENKVR